MTIRHGTTVLILGIVLALVAGPALAQTTAPHDHAAPPALDRPDFNAQIDVAVLGQLAVHRDGRVKTFESFAREMMGYVCGPRPYRGQPSVVTYLDFMFRPEAYAEADVIFVKSKLIRARIAEALTASIREQMETMGLGPVMVAELNRQVEAFRDTGRISVPMLQDAKVQALLARLETDLLRTAKFVRAIETATAVQDAGVLRRNLRIVPPPVGGFDDAWLTPEEFAAMMAGDPAARERVSGAWASLRTGWIEGDAAAVNAAGAELAAALPPLNPELYPDSGRLSWESWYFRMRNMTWVWVIYALSLIPLVLYTVFRWTGARWFGLLLFMAAFGLHTFAVGLRWYVAERFPNTNMFEAVTTAAWFGGCFALILEIALRKSPVRGLFALGSAASSMVALMAAHFLPVELNAGIGNRMPVLHDVWLYIHTNVIIFSYCLIFMASISAILYLFYRVGRAVSGRGGDHGADDFARVGGAGSLIMTTPDGGSYLTRAKTTLGQVLDGTTMIVLELSFIMLWAGLVMGAIWADHSWGRPWGWDPKEVFALNTFIIFALLIHTRLKVRDKGLWTAILAIVGCGVMLFNWIVINFTISGLHSYAVGRCAMPSSSLRLFVAVHPPAAVARDLLTALDTALRDRPDLAGRRTPADQVHLTLQFIGDVPARDVGAVTESVERSASGVGAFDLAPERLVTLPQRGPARLVAAGTNAPGELADVKQRLVNRLARNPRRASGRAFVPHLTLYRFRAPCRLESLDGALNVAPFAVGAIRLMRSRLRPTGAEHDVLAEFPLAT